MRYKICVVCGKKFRCKLAEKCKYWLNPLKGYCSCDNCNVGNKTTDCENVDISDFLDEAEKVIFT